MIGKECIIRTCNAGVHFGKVKESNGKIVVLENAIRIWYWVGAASLSQLAMEGVKQPKECKFAMPVDTIELTEAIEKIPCTPLAIENIRSVPSWKK